MIVQAFHKVLVGISGSAVSTADPSRLPRTLRAHRQLPGKSPTATRGRGRRNSMHLVISDHF